jgi:hypothetical protein
MRGYSRRNEYWAGAVAKAASAFLVIAAIPYSSASAGLRTVTRQSGAMGCGLATLSTLLSWSGYAISEQALTTMLRDIVYDGDPARFQKYVQQGASPGELQSLVEQLGGDLVLEKRVVTLEQARELARSEAFIVYLYEKRPGGIAGHFTVLAGYDPNKGWLRADSLDGAYAWQKNSDFSASALVQREGKGLTVLRLRRGSRIAARSENLGAVADEPVPWIETARLLAGLSPTSGTSMSLSLNRSVEAYDDNGVELRMADFTSSLSISHPLSPEVVVAASIPFSTGAAHLSIRDFSTFDLGSTSGIGRINLSISHRLKMRSKSGVAWIGLSGRLSHRLRQPGGSISATFSRAVGAKSAISAQLYLEGDRLARKWSFSLNPSLSFSHALTDRLTVGVNAISVVPLNRRQPDRTFAGASLDYQIGQRFGLTVEMSRSVTGPSGFSSEVLGLRITRRL